MSDPRNVAHAKKVTQEKKHHGSEAGAVEAASVQPGKKAATKKKGDPAVAVAESEDAAPVDDTSATSATNAPPVAAHPAALEGSLVVLTKLKEVEFHSRTSLERLAELAMTVEDELQQKEMVGPLSDVYAAQSALQTKLTTFIDAYKAECDRMQGQPA
jgi:hypothetical protein